VSVNQVVLLFSAVIGLVIGAFGLLVAGREWRNESPWWAWLVPGGFGAVLLVMSALKLVGAT
jgi:hypothetical protein